MTTFPPCFDQVFVISDVHMGGIQTNSQNFQIFNRGGRLAHFIEAIGRACPDGQVALVLNGDVFDSLAEDIGGGYVALDESTALNMMERLYTDAAFSPVWTALASFIRQPRHHLVLVVGNHDIELALPAVEHSIRVRLAAADREAWGRIQFSVHGAGFTCRVGHARVFCTHGNELDAWNWIDYSALGQLANALNAGRYVDTSRWQPNAGTRLVIDVMNEVKRRLPFVDLLKPERAAVGGVMMALDWELLRNIDVTRSWPVWRDKRKGQHVTSEMLGAYARESGPDRTPRVGAAAAYERLGPHLRDLVNQSGPRMTEEDLLLDAEQPLNPSLSDSMESMDTLGWRDIAAGRLGLMSQPEGLRRALLDWLSDDRTFELQNPTDELFLAMEERGAPSVDFVVTGHTHQPRAMTFGSGAHYYNAGTWIRSLRLTQEALQRPYFEKTLWPVLHGQVSVLDAARIPGPRGIEVPLVFDRTNAVRIVASGGRVLGDLLRVTDDATVGVHVAPEPDAPTLEARRA